MFENPGHFGRVEFEPGQPGDFARGKDDALVRLRNFAGERDFRGFAAAKFKDKRGGEFETGQQKAGSTPRSKR